MNESHDTNPISLARRGAIVLCGGHSTRMGTAKMTLPFGPELMIERIVRLLSGVCPTIVVVAAPGQTLPVLPAHVLIAQDRNPDRGPLEGLAAGLAALPPAVEAAYATSCDVPLLVPAFVERMFALLGEQRAAVPSSGGFLHPLAAVYRRSLLDVVAALLETDRRRPAFLFDMVPTRRVSEAELIDVDPPLNTLKNLNHPSEYLAALATAGFETPADVVAQLAKEEPGA